MNARRTYIKVETKMIRWYEPDATRSHMESNHKYFDYLRQFVLKKWILLMFQAPVWVSQSADNFNVAK